MSAIKDRIYIICADCFEDESKFDAAFSRLSDYRRAKIANLNHNEDKILSLAAGYLIDFGLREYGLCERDMQYALNENKKPYFTERRDICFNVSHSGNYAVCVFSDTEVGCDIETVRGYSDRLLKRFFAPRECEAVTHSPDRDREFIRFWTRKESFLKATGDGITRKLAEIDTTADIIEEHGKKYYFREYAAPLPLCVCKTGGAFEAEPTLVEP